MMLPWPTKKTSWQTCLLLLLLGFSAHALPSVAERNYRSAETMQFQLESFSRIANQLGFASLRQHEDHKLRVLFNRVLAAYFKVFQSKDSVWSCRAAYRVAELVDHFFQKQVYEYQPPYRSLRLPFAFEITPKSANLTASIIRDQNALQDELALLYETINKYAKILNKDGELLKDLRQKLKKIPKQNSIQAENVTSPFKRLDPGLLRDKNGQIEQLQKNGKWKTIAVTDLKIIQTAIKHHLQTIRLSGFVIAELHPCNQLISPLLMQWKKPSRSLFNNLQNTLFGEAEHILLALKAIVQKDQKSIESIMAFAELPAAEKAWLLSFASKNESTMRMAKELLNHEDALTVSRALWVLYQANPRAAKTFIQKHATDRRALVVLTANRLAA
jgi:hypothetical protein